MEPPGALRPSKAMGRIQSSENEPYCWQVDITEAITLGLDCILIAGTGKTMPFGMPLLLDTSRKKMVIVISPLNELELEQVRPC